MALALHLSEGCFQRALPIAASGQGLNIVHK